MQHATIYTRAPQLVDPQNAADNFAEMLGEPTRVLVKPCPRCTAPVVVLDGGNAPARDDG